MSRFSRLQILQNQVDCRNRLNREAEKLLPQLQEIFSRFVGKKIYKFTDHSLTAGVRKVVEPVEMEAKGKGFHCWFKVSVIAVYFCLTDRYQTSHESVDYCKAEFFVAGFDRSTGLMIEETREFIKRRCDYTVEEITAARDKIAELETELSNLKFSISEFDLRYC